MEPGIRADIDELSAAFAGRREQVRAWLESLSPEQVNWRPGPGRWSIAQCVDHLCQTTFRWAENLNPVLISAISRDVSHRGAYRPGPAGRFVAGLMETVRRPLSAPRVFRPRDVEDFDPRELVEDFDAAGDAWEAILRRASQVDLARHWVASPASRLIRMPVGTWLFALSAHEVRHLAQARAVSEAPGFPD